MRSKGPFLMMAALYSVASIAADETPQVQAPLAISIDRSAVTADNEVKVVFQALVGVDGRIKQGRIVKSTGNAATDAKIMEELKRSWRRRPAEKDGKPVEQWGQFTVIFKLED